MAYYFKNFIFVNAKFQSGVLRQRLDKIAKTTNTVTNLEML